MSNIETFRASVSDYIRTTWKKTFNPFDKERPRVAKYPASVTDHVEIELDGVPHMFRVSIRDIGTVSDFMKKAEEIASRPQFDLPPEMVTEILKVVKDFKRDEVEGQFVNT